MILIQSLKNELKLGYILMLKGYSDVAEVM